jgi:2-polyprenyl-3-methyl-5-hydroxy-6-metoxy-1,4-benzoquinol methylase
MTISDEYREMNTALHAKHKSYGASGRCYAESVNEVAERFKAESILDYGCGKGTLARAVGREVTEYDPAVPGKDRLDPEATFDLVVCTDVLEHVEPEHLYDVLYDIKRRARKAVFFAIATRPAKKTLPDGRNAHLIIRDAMEWLVTITPYFRLRVADSRPDDGLLLFVGEAR